MNLQGSFTRSRIEMLAFLESIGERTCSYASPVSPWPENTCDCKYGGPSDRTGSEQTGCPELRDLHALLGQMTDDQWSEYGEARLMTLLGGQS